MSLPGHDCLNVAGLVYVWSPILKLEGGLGLSQASVRRKTRKLALIVRFPNHTEQSDSSNSRHCIVISIVLDASNALPRRDFNGR